MKELLSEAFVVQLASLQDTKVEAWEISLVIVFTLAELIIALVLAIN